MNADFESVTVMIEGMCASAATLLATIPGANVIIAEGSEFMIHNPMTITWGNAEEIEKDVTLLRQIEEQCHSMYAAKTGQDVEQIKEWMDATTWFTAKDAVKNGFCDELLEKQPIAACVTPRDMALMKVMYGDIPDQVEAKEETAPEDITVSNGNPVAGLPSEINQKKEENPMELENLTLDQLREGNPALFDQVRQDAVTAERERLSDIDALTVPGYEEMAEQAKAEGTSAMDFQRQIVAAMKQKGTNFLQARQQETAPAGEVAGGQPQDNAKTEEQEILDDAKAIAEFAQQYAPVSGGMY